MRQLMVTFTGIPEAVADEVVSGGKIGLSERLWLTI